LAKESVDNKDICELVREQEHAFTSGGGTLTSKYVTSDLYEDISKIDAYLESTHISGPTDSQGRDKPFFNIVIAARNVWYRATDIDRGNILIKPTKSADTVSAFLATVLLQNWMRRESFGAFLNSWGLVLAAYNSAVVKFIESGGRLHCMVVPWARLICDQVDFAANPKIELLELTEAQLYQRVRTHGYDSEMVDKLCDALAARELTSGEDVDQKDGYVKLYEVHGNLPVSYLTGLERDEDEYAQQMHVVSFVASKEEGKFDDFTLYSGRESQDPYLLTSLMPSTDGSVSLNGSVKQLFTPQWMMNHTVKSIKDQLDVASKLLFQTSDANFVGRNVLTAVEQGEIMVHAVNQPLTQVNNDRSSDVTSQQKFGEMWKGLASEIAGVSESMLGNAAPSGTAWRQVEALLQESHSLFELMTENKALHVEEMMRRFVIPFLKKQMDTAEEISATLESHNVQKIDAIYVPKEAIRRHNQRVKDAVLKGDVSKLTPFDPATGQQEVKDELSQLGNQRFFIPSDADSTTWKESLKDLEWELEVDITGEQADKQTVMTTLNTMLQIILNPAYAGNQQAQMVVGKILQQTGVISPIEISTMPPPQPLPQPVDAGNAVGKLPAQPTQ
jgi:hypothetical protein